MAAYDSKHSRVVPGLHLDIVATQCTITFGPTKPNRTGAKHRNEL